MCSFFFANLTSNFPGPLDSQIENNSVNLRRDFSHLGFGTPHSVESFDGLKPCSPMAGCLQSMIPNWALVVEIFIIEMLWSHNLVAKWLVLVDDVGWGNCFSWFIVWLGGVVWKKKSRGT